MRERCPRCSLVFERIEGQWLGSLGLNTIITFALLFVVVVAGVFATAPDVAVVPLVIAAVPIGLLICWLCPNSWEFNVRNQSVVIIRTVVLLTLGTIVVLINKGSPFPYFQF